MLNNLFPIKFMDPPEVLNTSTTNIPGYSSLPLQVIADSGTRAAYAIDYLDTTGENIGVFTGDIGSETLRCILGGGVVTRAHVVIAANSRVSIKSMTSVSPITNGRLSMTLMGMGLGPGAG